MTDPNTDEIIERSRKLASDADATGDGYERRRIHKLRSRLYDTYLEALAAEIERLRGRVTELETLEAGYVKVLRELTRGGPQ